MQQTAPHNLASNVSVRSTRDQHKGVPLEKSFRKSRQPKNGEDAERARFARLLWRAFPDAKSENELAELAAMVLTSESRPVDKRTVRNWLRCENAPHFRYVIKVIALVGAEAVFQMIDPEVGE
ncbi:hypothetical protein [Ketogulonicigenium vulgare]|uniref:hypothetical protein n=1 Tax=Ketogulonicigenium vulgare TaxID=92945 RepID=UPI00235870D7|nr:hypothetical protein [Ketogulonicigenium vulgare]